MIYLDYSATTPVSPDVLDTYNKITKEFVGNANSLNYLGIKSDELLKESINQIAKNLGCLDEEVTFTSGATEANNLAIIGTVMANHKKGNHIIVSKLEHPSIYAICDYLKTIGFEISYVNNDKDGLVDFDDLKRLMKKTTILVSIALVNSELGIRQPLKMVRQVIKKENKDTFFHSDMTQGIGKIPINILDVDLASMTGHKIYAPKGIGLLYKRKSLKINPLIYGSGKSNELNPGTPALPLIGAFSKALKLAISEQEKRISLIERLNEKIEGELKNKEGILINKTTYSIPQILNISLVNIKPETFIRAMDEKEIYLSTNTACSSGKLSNSVLALYNDKVRASHTIRISISHLTTLDEVNRFLKYFNEVYEKLNNM